MPRVAMDYSKIIIYHFVCKDEMIKCSYVGSTTNFVKRKTSHKSNCINETKKEYTFKVYQTIRNNGGWYNWDMKPLEEYPCENKTQQVIREQYWIDKLKPDMNCYKAYSTEEQLKEYKKEYQKEYAKNNAESITEYKKQNKEKIKEKMKQYREANKEIIAEKNKVYRDINRDKLNEKRRKISI